MSRAFTRRIAARWLRSRLPAPTLSATLGDLDEEFQDVCDRQGRWQAETWFISQVWSVGRAYAHEATHARGSAPGRLGRDVLLGLRESVRSLHHDPLYAVAASVSLGVGLAAVLATAGLTDTILNRPINSSDPGSVRRLASVADAGSVSGAFSYPELEIVRGHLGTQGAVAASTLAPVLVRFNTTTTQDMVDVVTGPFFDALGARALMGRSLTAHDDLPDQPRLIVISDRFWRAHLGASPHIVGQHVALNSLDYTIIGVAPATPSLGFFGTSAAGWVPAATADSLLTRGWQTNEDDRTFVALVHLPPGSAPAALSDGLSAAATTLGTEFPARWRDRHLTSQDGLVVTGSLRRLAVLVSLLLGLLALLVLVVAMANVAGLIHAQWASRRRIAGVRWALGASRRAVAAPMLCEGALLGLAGSVLAVTIYAWFRAGAASISLLPTVTLQIELPWSGSLAAATLAIGVGTGLLITLWPSWSAARMASVSFAELTGRSGAGASTARTRRVLVAGQLAASLVLVVLATLFTRSLDALHDAPLGIDVDRLAIFDFDIEPVGAQAESLGTLAAFAIERVAAVPGITAVAMASRAPVDASTPSGPVRVGKEDIQDVTRLAVTVRYFDTAGLPVVNGRAFRASDVGRDVAIINETFARRLGTESGFIDLAAGKRLEVVGVARDAKYRSISEPAQPHFYTPVAPGFHLALHVRTDGDPRSVMGSVQTALDSTGPGIQGFFPRTGRDHLQVDMLTTSTASLMARTLGAVAAALAAIGLYGVLLWTVQTRRQEIGVRMALGAGARSVRWFIFTQALRSAWPGVLTGLVVAVVASWALRAQWFGVGALDPIVLLVVSGTQVAIVVIATWIPAHRATRVSPTELLR